MNKQLDKSVMRLMFSDGTHKDRWCNSLRTARKTWNDSVDNNENPLRGEWLQLYNGEEHLLGYVNKGEYFTKQQLKVYT